MYALCEAPKSFCDLIKEASEALNSLISTLELSGEEVVIARTQDLFANPEYLGKVYIITEGNYLWNFDDSIAFILESGDLLGLHELVDKPFGRYSSDFGVTCKAYSSVDFLNSIRKTQDTQNMWNRYLTIQLGAMEAFLISKMTSEKIFSPSIRAYFPGDMIIKQGDASTDVYTLLEGAAKVVVDGVDVGRINQEEVFGAFSALTGQPRSASVISTADSLAMILDKDKFIELIQNKPGTILKMVEDMARIITDLNKKVVEGETSAWTKSISAR